MTLFVADRSISHPRLLSERCRRVVHLIDEADAWLQWAIGNQDHRYYFADEPRLLDGLQKGLHGSDLAWLPRVGLQVSPSKLLSLGANDLDALYRLEQGEDGSALAGQVASVLSRHALLTNAMLKSSQSFLSAIGAGDAPLLQQLDLRGSVALWHLAAEYGAAADGSGPHAEAAGFALQHARHPLEFCDYYRFYLHVEHPDGSAGQRLANATRSLNALRPLWFDTLDAPQVQHLPSLQEARQIIDMTLAACQQIGFARISLAVQQVAPILRGLALEEPTIHAASRQLLRDVHAVLRTYPLQHGQLGQDGTSMRFPIEAPGVHIVLQVEDDAITLAEYTLVSGDRDRDRAAEATPDAPHSDQGDAEPAAPQDLAAARAQAEQTLASARAALLHMPGARTGGTLASSGDGDIPPPVPSPGPATPEDARTPRTSPLQIAQALADAAMVASEQAIREAMAASQQAIDAANEALRRADAAAEEAVRRATEAAAEDEASWKKRG